MKYFFPPCNFTYSKKRLYQPLENVICQRKKIECVRTLRGDCKYCTLLKEGAMSSFQCNMDYFVGDFDLGVCLHACGVAADLVLQTCMEKGANFVVCPCCYGFIKNTHTVQYPRSQTFKKSVSCEVSLVRSSFENLSETI